MHHATIEAIRRTSLAHQKRLFEAGLAIQRANPGRSAWDCVCEADRPNVAASRPAWRRAMGWVRANLGRGE